MSLLKHDIMEPVRKGMAETDRILSEELLRDDSESVMKMFDHIGQFAGKRLRPALLLLTAELCGYTGPRRVQIAAAIELLHTATLIHDDVVDFSDLRRGQRDGYVRKDVRPTETAAFLVAALEGVVGIAKPASDAKALKQSVGGFVGFLRSLQPK